MSCVLSFWGYEENEALQGVMGIQQVWRRP
jgi:hypothetical protein